MFNHVAFEFRYVLLGITLWLMLSVPLAERCMRRALPQSPTLLTKCIIFVVIYYAAQKFIIESIELNRLMKDMRPPNQLDR